MASQSDHVFSSPTRDVRSLTTNEKREFVAVKGQDAAMVHDRALNGSLQWRIRDREAMVRSSA
jgi:hypothetical protein